MHRRVHDDDVGALADPLEVGDLQSRDLRLGFLRVAHHALELARKLLQPESTTRLLVVTVRIAMKRTLCILSELMADRPRNEMDAYGTEMSLFLVFEGSSGTPALALSLSFRTSIRT